MNNLVNLTDEQLALIIAEKTSGKDNIGNKCTSKVLEKAKLYLKWLKESKPKTD